MRRSCALAALIAFCCSGALFAVNPEPPKIDKAKLESYIRYTEGFTSEVRFSIDDPVASAYQGYFRVVAHLTKGQNRLDRVYYVSPDGLHFINGAIWDLSESPFLDTLEHLPTDGPSFGPANAKVTIVVFSDFECPYCRELAKTIRDNLPQKYPNDVRVIYQDFPIASIHPWARAAAEASHCIANESVPAFWLFHDWIFEHQQEISPDNIQQKVLDFGKEHHLDLPALSGCINSHVTGPAVDRSLTAGQGLQIEQTPTLFVNGRTIGGAVSWEQLQSVINLELKRPADVPGPSTGKCCQVTIPKVINR